MASLVLFENLTDFPLEYLDNNSIIFLKDPSEELVKKINIRGLQYIEVVNYDLLEKIYLNYIVCGRNCLIEGSHSLIEGSHSLIEGSHSLDVPRYLFENDQLICQTCSKISKDFNEVLSDTSRFAKITSQEPLICCQKSSQNISEVFEDIINNVINNDNDINLIYTITDPIYNVKGKTEKLQDSVLKEAKRQDFSTKREIYKKNMGKGSSAKSITSEGSLIIKHESINLCKAITKNGIKCKNKCLKNSEFCGILSHKVS